MSFKIALDAGHCLSTPGKRCLKSLDPKETREWTLNDRIADKVEMLLQGFTGWELIRVDDTLGKKDIRTKDRAKAANAFGADIYLSLHHNAGIEGGKGGGIVVYISKNASRESAEWQKEVYNELIAATGLKGNRSNPTPKNNYTVLTKTKMPAILCELGFMDSQTDAPKILSEEYADQCAAAIVKVLVRRGGLVKKQTAPAKRYYVQAGVFSTESRAKDLVAALKKAGFEAIIKEG